MNDVAGRRPLKTRQVELAQKAARYISGKNISPNQISMFSLVFAIFAGLCLLFLPSAQSTGTWLLPVLTAIFIQCRLLCNLFDGMVAIEGGKQSKSGELYNDIPDRFADAIILICAGYAIPAFSFAVELGWLAALLAVMTAYVRTLAASVHAPMNFQGPMAKPHRMAVMTAACLLTAFENGQGYALLIALLLIIAGSIVTLYNRIRAAHDYLEHRDTV